MLNILTDQMEASVPGVREHGDVLGVAYGSFAYVFYPRIKQVADEWVSSESNVLGRAVAHELGHALLGGHSHTATGIMKARFDRNDVATTSNQFLFEGKQAARLRKVLEDRAASKDHSGAQ